MGFSGISLQARLRFPTSPDKKRREIWGTPVCSIPARVHSGIKIAIWKGLKFSLPFGTGPLLVDGAPREQDPLFARFGRDDSAGESESFHYVGRLKRPVKLSL